MQMEKLLHNYERINVVTVLRLTAPTLVSEYHYFEQYVRAELFE
jgi:hypothetical protein